MKAFRKAVRARCALALSRLLPDPDDAELAELRDGCLVHSLGWNAFHTGAARMEERTDGRAGASAPRRRVGRDERVPDLLQRLGRSVSFP